MDELEKRLSVALKEIPGKSNDSSGGGIWHKADEAAALIRKMIETAITDALTARR